MISTRLTLSHHFSSPPSPPPAKGAMGIADVKSDKSSSYNDERTDNITTQKKY
jgi:hypothetical protein